MNFKIGLIRHKHQAFGDIKLFSLLDEGLHFAVPEAEPIC